MDLLRLATAGSVDDGKSTLIGRLLLDGETPFMESVRYRTVGDLTITGAVRSTAATLEEVIAEIAATRVTERGETRADDRFSEAAMEDRKRVGYF